PRAESRTVERREMGEPAEVDGRLLRRHAGDRHVQAAADHAGDLAERHALFRDPVIPGSRSALLERQPEQIGRIEPVHRGPAVASIAYIRGNALVAGEIDEQRHEPVITLAMDRGRKAHDRYACTAGCGRSGRLFRGDAWNGRRVRAGRIRFGPEAPPPPPRRQQTGPGGDAQAAPRARERGAERRDDAPIGLTVLLEPREVVVERGMNHAVRGGRSALQAVEISERAAVDVGACRGEGRRRRIRAREAEYVVPCRDELLYDGGADEAG